MIGEDVVYIKSDRRTYANEVGGKTERETGLRLSYHNVHSVPQLAIKLSQNLL